MMMPDQVLPAFIAALVHEGVEARTIERAILRAASVRLGESISGGRPMVRAFAFEQARILERAHGA